MISRGMIGALAIALLSVVAIAPAEARDPNKVRCTARDMDGSSLAARYERERREFRADFRAGNRADLQPGDVLNVRVNDQVVGQIVLDRSGSGTLEFDEQDKPFPANFPPFPPGTVTTVGTISCVGQRR